MVSVSAEALGVEELNAPDSVVVVEWPDRCPGAFHEFTLRLRIHTIDETHRSLDGWWGKLPFAQKERIAHWKTE